MSAPAEIYHPKRQDYYACVRAFLPSARGEELDTRASILLIRDRALAALSIDHTCDEAAEILNLVHKNCVRYAFMSLALADLKEVRRLLLNLTAAASSFQLFVNEQGCTPEGKDARG